MKGDLNDFCKSEPNIFNNSPPVHHLPISHSLISFGFLFNNPFLAFNGETTGFPVLASNSLNLSK